MRRLFFTFLFLSTLFLVNGCKENSTNPIINIDSLLAPFYDSAPDIINCSEGTVKQSEKNNVLARLNYIRSLHGLSAVTYNNAGDKYTQKAALITAANNVLNHYPTPASSCYSIDGAFGCRTSNLWLGNANTVMVFKSETMINDWLNDLQVTELGHRRWLLNPFLKTISFGRVDYKKSATSLIVGSAIQIMQDTLSSWTPITLNKDYIAFPEGDYPSNVFRGDWYMSFTAIIDKTTFWNNTKVDYSGATISIADDNNNSISVTNISYNTQGYGLPNNIQWLVGSYSAGVKYNVTISNVVVNGTTRNYTYWFKIVTVP